MGNFLLHQIIPTALLMTGFTKCQVPYDPNRCEKGTIAACPTGYYYWTMDVDGAVNQGPEIFQTTADSATTCWYDCLSRSGCMANSLYIPSAPGYTCYLYSAVSLYYDSDYNSNYLTCCDPPTTPAPTTTPAPPVVSKS